MRGQALLTALDIRLFIVLQLQADKLLCVMETVFLKYDQLALCRGNLFPN